MQTNEKPRDQITLYCGETISRNFHRAGQDKINK